jgi:hypothetical protein
MPSKCIPERVIGHKVIDNAKSLSENVVHLEGRGRGFRGFVREGRKCIAACSAFGEEGGFRGFVREGRGRCFAINPKQPFK